MPYLLTKPLPTLYKMDSTGKIRAWSIRVELRNNIPYYVQIHGVKDAYAIGDCAAITNPDGKQVPDLAQSAVVEGKTVAAKICAVLKGKKQKKFVFRSKGFLISVGKGFGVAEMYLTEPQRHIPIRPPAFWSLALRCCQIRRRSG